MNQNSNPLDYLIECCERSANSGYWTLTTFSILNAKDELRKLRKQVDESNQFKNIAWARINDRGDIYDLTIHYNRFADPNTLLPIYSNMKEFKEKYGKLSK